MITVFLVHKSFILSCSFSGASQRRWCGEDANPPGVYFSFVTDAAALLDVSILKLLIAEANARVYAFVSVDTDRSDVQLSSLLKDLITNLQTSVKLFLGSVADIIDKFTTLMSTYSQNIITTVKKVTQNLITLIAEALESLRRFQLTNLPFFLDKLRTIWEDGWQNLEGNSTLLIDSLRNNTRLQKFNLTANMKHETEKMRYDLNMAFQAVTNDLTSTLSEKEGFGLRFLGGINVLGVKVIGLDVELVYSIDALGRCSRFKSMYEHLQGEETIRGLLTVSKKRIVRVHPLIEFVLDKSYSIGFAISKSGSGNFVLQIHIETTIVGIRKDVDLFVTNRGVYYYLQGEVWGLFLAQIAVYAEHNGEWNGLTLGVQGKFLADTDGDGTFQDSYLSALRRGLSFLSDEADKRIGMAQDKLTDAQHDFTRAQHWLESKKADVEKANAVFDSAIHTLESAKATLEGVKRQFQDALDKLNDAQMKVDNLCKIRTCKSVCIPGIKLRICRGWFGIRYPCLKWTSCMISIPNLVCVAKNILCKLVRGVAYLALEAAKIFIRIPMLAIDVAKGTVTVAQFVVDKSRVVLEIAKIAIDLAILGLEGAKGILELAKRALEGVKLVVRYGLMALNYIIMYGIQSIIDIRNCGFEITVSTHDETVFDVHCEVNALKTGWKIVRIRINFTDIIQSIWNAAKATIEAIFRIIGIGKRKKRELQHQTMHTLYTYFRQTRDAEGFSEAEVNETIDVIAQTIGFQNAGEGNAYEFRQKVFQRKCQDFVSVYNFLNDSICVLRDISEETATTLTNSSVIIDEIDNAFSNNTISDMSFKEIGIDPIVAENDFNISIGELTELIKNGTDSLTNDEFLNDIRLSTEEATEILQNQTDDANNVNILNQWILAMENLTTNHFGPDVCASFLDCSFYAISVLYEMYTESGVANRLEFLDLVSNFENAFLNLTGNFSHTILDVNVFALELDGYLDHMQQKNVFCYTPPVMMEPLANKTIATGETLELVCNVTGDPIPTFEWSKDDEIIEKYTSMVLSIPDVTTNDTGWYFCVAGNLVANLTMRAAFVHATGK